MSKPENLSDDWIIVIDIETTGLEPRYHMICEIGFCFLNLLTGEIENGWNIICQEKGFKLNPHAWIFHNSCLNYNDVINSPYLEDCREELQDVFDLGYPITAFNQQFDFGFLQNRKFRIDKKFFDPMIELTPIMKLPFDYNKYKWPSVQEAYDYFFPDANFIELHRALDDAIHEAYIIFEIWKLLNEMKKS